MNSEQINLVQASFRDVRPVAAAMVALYMRRLLELAPSLRPMFGSDPVQQGEVWMAMLASTVNRLTEPESLVPVFRELGARQARRGVGDAHYTAAGEALLWTLGQSLGARLTPAAADAWAVAYAQLSDAMKQGAAQSRRPMATA